MFKKPKRNIRRRGIFDENDEDNAMEVDDTPKEEKTKDKPKQKAVAKKSAVLSFAEEFDEADEGEIFQVKKSSQSRKFRKQAGKEKERELKEKDDKKKKEESNENFESKSNKNEQIVSINEVTLKIKNPIAGPVKSYNNILNGREAEVAELSGASSDEDDKTNKGVHMFSKSDYMKEILQSGKIPDAAMIHAARKKRQKAREMGDYEPISDKPSTMPVEQNKRLIHEDENEDGSASDDERVDMSNINTTAIDRRNRQEAFESAQLRMEEDSESDKGEEDAWEQQQIKKGVTGTQLATAQAENIYIQSYQMPKPPPTSSKKSSAPPLPPTPVYLPSLSSQAKFSNPGDIVSSLRARLDELKEIHSKHVSDKESLLEEFNILQIDRETLNKSQPLLAKNFKFYQDIRGYVTDLVECIDEKIPVLVGLEQRLISLYQRQASSLIARRRQDVKDQANENSPANPNNKILGIGNARNTNEELTRRIAEREGRRIRRIRQREKEGKSNGHVDGMSSDEEITESESNAFRLQKETIESDARLVFDDVNEEFAAIESILHRFETWKGYEKDKYKDAYVNICLPKILGPFVRFNILFWNPLVQNFKCLEQERWFQSILSYGLESGETETSLEQDPDLLLLPKIVDKFILAKVEQMVKAAYDPLSNSQTVCLVTLISKLIQDYPTIGYESKILNSLLDGVVEKFKVAVDEDVFIPIYMNEIESGRTSLFFQRQFASAVKLLGNIVRWQGLLSDEVVIKISIDSLLNRYLILGLRTFSDAYTAAEKCKLVTSVLPRSWLNPNTTIPQLEMFTKQVKQVTERLRAGT